jgi:hypothetical protein
VVNANIVCTDTTIGGRQVLVAVQRSRDSLGRPFGGSAWMFAR